MQDLASDTEEVGDETQSTAAEMEAAATSMEGSIEAVRDEIEQLQDAIDSVTTRSARRALSRLENAIDGVDFDNLANSAIQASAAIESRMEDAEDSLIRVGVAGLEAGQAIESGAEDGEEAYEDLTGQVLAAKAAIESIDGAGPETDVDLQSQRGPTGGAGPGFGTVAVAVGLKEVLENTSGIGAKISKFGGAVEELEDAATQLRLAAVAIGKEQGVNMPIFVDNVSEEDGDDGDDARRRLGSSSLANGFHGLARAIGDLTASIPPVVKKFAAVAAAGGVVVLGLGALDIAAGAAAGGLAAFATKLALDYGTDELKRDLQAVGAQYKETAELFVQAFEPILRNAVIPALQTFNRWLRANIGGLRSFLQSRIPQLQEFVGSLMMLADAFGELFHALTGGAMDALSDGIQHLATQLYILGDIIEYFFGDWGERKNKTPVRTQNQAPFSGGGDIGGDYTVSMGSDEQVQFGPGATPDVDRSALVGDKLGPVMNGMAKQIARIRQRAAKGLISQEEMLRQIVSARETAFKEVQKLAQKFPSISDALINFLTGQVKAAQAKLGKRTLRKETEQPADASKVEPAQSTLFPLLPSVEDQLKNKAPQQLSGQGGGLSAFKGAAKAADSVSDINSLIGAVRKNFDELNNDEARGFIGVLQRMRAEMKEAKTEAEAIGNAMAQSVARAADRVFQSIGDAVSGAIFGGGRRSSAQAKLNLFNAKEQVRSLRESLRQGQISYRKFALRLKVQQNQIQKRQEQLNDTMQSGFAQAAESMLAAFKSVGKQLIAQITAVVAKMAVLKAITSALSIGSGGFLGSVISNLGGGGFLDSAATGGTVRQSGIAQIHTGEEIVPSATVDTLKSLLQPGTPSAEPAVASAAGMNVTVQIEGETRTAGGDLVTSYDTTKRTQRRKGHSSR